MCLSIYKLSVNITYRFDVEHNIGYKERKILLCLKQTFLRDYKIEIFEKKKQKISNLAAILFKLAKFRYLFYVKNERRLKKILNVLMMGTFNENLSLAYTLWLY